MKKKILALTLAAFTFGIVAANAQNETTTDANGKAKTECCQKDGKKCDKKGDKEARREARAKLNPFNGIELTAEQKAQLKDLKEQQKAGKKKTKEARQEERAAKAAAYDAEVAKILTPEQYQTYQANREAMKEARQKKMKKAKEKMARKHNGSFKAEREANPTAKK